MCNNKATTSKCFRLYGRLITKKRKILLDIQFLTKCRRRDLIPKFIHIKSTTNSQASQKAVKSARKIWLLEEIRFKHQALSVLEEQLYSLHMKLLKQVEYHSVAECIVYGCEAEKKLCWQSVLASVDRNLRKRVSATKKKHRKKLALLAQAQTPRKLLCPPRVIDKFVVNLSSVQLSTAEHDLLNKGLNFAIPPQCAPVAEVVNSIESAVQFENFSAKSALRHDINSCISDAAQRKSGSKQLSFELEKVMRQLKDRNVFYSRADKGNAVVIMDKTDYDNRVRDMISSGPYEEFKYKNGKPRDPLNMLIEEANCTRQKVARLMGEDKLERKFIVPNPKVASLYCLPKIHKNPMAMRPISSNVCTPTEKMAAWLVQEMRKYPVTRGKSVKNSVDLVDKLKGFESRRGEILVSFDVTALFPSVPVEEALRSMRTHLERCRAPPNHIEAYLAVGKTCMNQNFFLFRGKFYKQTFGLSMGSKLSPLLADLFMSDFEVELAKEKLFPRVWWRYVDDIFATLKERHLPKTLELLNSRHNSIKFTVEKEAEGKLPFLDLMITRKEDNSVKFGIYRKPTSTDRYITSDSNHFGAQKQAAFHSMVHRLLHIPMEKPEYEAEKEKIYQAGILNGYGEEFVNRILRKHVRKKRRENLTTLVQGQDETRRISLPFYPKVTNGIQAILAEHGWKVAYKSGNTLRDSLCALKDKIPQEELSGIYEIPCKSCPAVYIGQTRRKFKTRLREHKNAVDNNRANESSVAAHAVELDHTVDWDEAKLKKCVRKTFHLNAWESMFISTAKQELMNEDDAPISSPLFKLTTQKIK